MGVFINSTAIHMDPKHYPNPKIFNPENFRKEIKAERHPMTFFGFGLGPRSCIAQRFALLEMKVSIVAVLHKFNLVRNSKTEENPKLSQRGEAINGLHISV